MNMNQLIWMLQTHIGVDAHLPQDEKRLLRRSGIIEKKTDDLTKKGDFICRKLLEFANDAAQRDFEGCSGYDDQDEDDTDWKAEAERYKTLLQEVYVALNDILELGRKDFHNPKYDEYFRAGNDACRKARRALGITDEV